MILHLQFIIKGSISLQLKIMDTVIIIAEIVKDSRFYWSEKQNLAIN